MDVREKKITENEILAEERLGKATDLLNRQTNINKILVDTEKERDIYKREMERIKYLQFEIQDLKRNAEKWKNECSINNDKVAALNETVSEQKKKIAVLEKLYNAVYDIAEYACKKLKIDVDRAIQKRSDGYRTTYIFGDEKKRSR